MASPASGTLARLTVVARRTGLVVGPAALGRVTEAYANPVAFLVLGAFMMVRAVEECRLSERLALGVLARIAGEPAAFVAGFMLVAGLLSMWMFNTAITLMLVPIGLSVIEQLESEGFDTGPGFSAALLLGIAYAANLGGFATLVGTAAPAITAGIMENYNLSVGFAQWMLVALPVSVVMIAAAWFVLCRVIFRLPRRPMPSRVQPIMRSRYAALGPIIRGECRVAVLAIGTAGLWVLRPTLQAATGLRGLSDAGIAVAAAIPLFLVPSGDGPRTVLLDLERAKRAPWGILLLVGGGFALAQALQETGVARWMSAGMERLDQWPPLLAAGSLVTGIVFLTELATSGTIPAFVPIVAATAVAMGENPLVLAMPLAIGSCCAFMLPVATPPNAVVFATGRVRLSQMMVAGFVMNLVAILAITSWVPLAARLVFG
jgi:sodium-dependent dicarboxylate transporter 2/3/5